MILVTETERAEDGRMDLVVREITEGKKRFLSLLMLGDEQEELIDAYLGRGRMYILDDGDVKAVCVVTDEGDGVLEIQNIAVVPEAQGKGYGRQMIRFLENEFRGRFHSLQAGTGDSPLTVPFYEKCGFIEVRRIPDYFTDHYDHPIYEAGVLLKDRIIFRKEIS